jgi:DnaJ homolog subfamily C member 19
MKWLLAALVIWAAWHFLSRSKAKVSDEMRARAVLGVGAAAGEDAIRAAHRRKVAEAHPDRGGSEALTREVNAARDLLLRGR